eukprot:COSAG02_NODE_80_length_40128_cov_591.169002_20_plen_92_part_00
MGGEGAGGGRPLGRSVGERGAGRRRGVGIIAMQRDDAKPVARPQGANRRTRTLAEWCALRKYQYTVVTGSGEYGRRLRLGFRISQVHVHAQ